MSQEQLRAEIAEMRAEMMELRGELRTEMAMLRGDVATVLERELRAQTWRLCAAVLVAFGVLATLLRVV